MAGSTENVQHFTADPKKQFGIELVRHYLADPDNEQVRKEFFGFCQERITAIVRYLVIGKGYFLPSEDKDEYVRDACQDVVVKVLENIESLNQPENLFAWLRQVSFHVIVEAYRHAIGRGHEKHFAVDNECKDSEGGSMSVFETQHGRDAAILHLGRSLTEDADADRWIEKIHDRAVLDKALAIHGNSGRKRDFESSLWIKETWDHPDVTAEQIAKLRHRSVGDTHHILRDDNDAIIPLTKYLLDPEAAEREWAVLIKDIEAALGEDPTGPQAQALAARWERLGGHIEGMQDLRAQHSEQTNRPAPLMLSDVKRTFICRAVEASEKRKPGSTLSHHN